MREVRIYQDTYLTVNQQVILNDDNAHHLITVLRFKRGAAITLFNGDGNNYKANVIDISTICVVKILAVSANKTESKLNLALAQTLLKGEKMDFLIQKAVELGVNKIIPITTERCVLRLNDKQSRKRHTHWQKIIISACSQSGRSIVPKLHQIISLDDLLQQEQAHCFVLHHRAKTSLLSVKPVAQALILIGAEGGFSEDEISRAESANYQPLLLGSRVLRAETASLASIANMQLLWGS